MASKWMDLFHSVLYSEAYTLAFYVPAGSWSKLNTVIKPSRKEIDCYEAVAVLTNIDAIVYVSRKFILPSRVPQYALARYICVWDEVNHAVKVELRQARKSIQNTSMPIIQIYGSQESEDGKVSSSLAEPAHTGDPVKDQSSSTSTGDSSGDSNATAQIDTSTDAPRVDACFEHDNSIPESPAEAYKIAESSPPKLTSVNDVPSDIGVDPSESPIKPHLLERPGAPTPGRGRTRYLVDNDSDEEDCSLVAVEDPVIDDVFGGDEDSFSCGDSYQKLPRLDPGVVDLSVAVDALDLAAEHNACSVHSRLEWLDLDSREEIRGLVEDIVEEHQQMNHQDMQEWMQEALQEVNTMSLPAPCVQQNLPMEIDLDAYFEGQGATDLEEDFPEGSQEQMQNGASISNVPDQTVSVTFDHYNWFGDRIPFRSSTPAGVSLLVQLAAERKRPFAEVCRKGVLLAQANKCIDVVDYNGPLTFDELQKLRGAAFQDHVTGHAVKITDPQGHFCDPRDGDAVLKDFDSIWDHFLAPKTQPTMQRPYLVADLGQDHGQSKGWIVPPPNFTQFFRQRNVKGEVVHWGLDGVEKPSKRCSKLYLTHSLDDELDHPPACPGQIEELSDSSRGSSISAGKEDAAIEYPSGSDESIEEYSPFDPVIPGQQRVYEADSEPQEEISEEEMSRRINALLGQATEENQVRQQEHSDDSASDNESSDQDQQRSSRATSPPSPVIPQPFDHSVYDSSSSFSKVCAIDDSTSVPETVDAKPLDDAVATPPSAVDFAAVYDSSLSFSNVSVLPDTIPAESLQQLGQPDPVSDSTPSDDGLESEGGLSRYAFGFACFMFGLGIGAAIVF
ncbi:MAG: hypothetical protein Q9184_001250 [Pyrenodesmia sp. 2 TL-2023]